MLYSSFNKAHPQVINSYLSFSVSAFNFLFIPSFPPLCPFISFSSLFLFVFLPKLTHKARFHCVRVHISVPNGDICDDFGGVINLLERNLKISKHCDYIIPEQLTVKNVILVCELIIVNVKMKHIKITY